MVEFEKLLDALYGFPDVQFAQGGEISALDLPKSLSIDSLGSIPLPLSPDDASRIRAEATQAPYGLGSETLVDRSVRQAWQIDAARVSCPDNFLTEVAHSIASQALSTMGMGMDAAALGLQVKLYKLLMYEQGGHFKSHRDTEKGDGMFATMIIQLPTQTGHQGGSLVVNHGGSTKTFDFSGEGNNSKSFSITFFADCKHELLEVTEGTRLCLAFNLLRTNTGGIPISVPDASLPYLLNALKLVQSQLLPWVKDIEDNFDKPAGPKRLAIPLAHGYSQKSLSFAGLKGHDRVVAELLKNCGCDLELHLGIFTKHRQVNDDQFGGNETELDYTVGNWVTLDDNPAGFPENAMFELGHDIVAIYKLVNVPRETLPWEKPKEPETEKEYILFSDDPDEEEYTGFRGNEGGWTDYWYRVGVLVVWPKSKSVQVVSSTIGIYSALVALKRKYENLEHEGLEDVRWLVGASLNKSQGIGFGKLLKLCVKLGLREEALSMAKKIDRRGIENGDVAKALAKGLATYGLDACGFDDLIDSCKWDGQWLKWDSVASGFVPLAIRLQRMKFHEYAVAVVNKVVNKMPADFNVAEIRRGQVWVFLLCAGRQSVDDCNETSKGIITLIHLGDGLIPDGDINKLYYKALSCLAEVAVAGEKEELEDEEMEFVKTVASEKVEMVGALTEMLVKWQASDSLGTLLSNEEFTSALGASSKACLRQLVESRLAFLGTKPDYDCADGPVVKKLKALDYRSARVEFDLRLERWHREVHCLKALLLQ